MRFCIQSPGPLPETKIRKDMMAPWGYAVVPTEQQAWGSSVISMEGGKYMEWKPVSIAAKKRDSTIYIAEYTISDNAKESAYEKVKRLILKDTKSYLEKSA